MLSNSALAEVLLINGFSFAPEHCQDRYYSESDTPSLVGAVVVRKTANSTAISFKPPEPGSPTVRAWLLEQARQIVADAPVVVRAVPPRPVSLSDMGDKACRDRAKLLIQTLRDAAAANRRHANQPDYIPYDIEGFFARMHHPNELQKMLAE